MSSATLPPEAAAYLAALEHELRDLPSDERAELLEEVEASLLEGGEAHGDPARFAAELRASAGLPPLTPPSSPSLWSRLAPTRESARTVLRELAPLWWVLRAYIAVEAIAGLLTHGGVPVFPHNGAQALVIPAAAVVSIALGIAGRRHPDSLRGVRILANVALLVACAFVVPPIVTRIQGRLDNTVSYATEPVIPAGLADGGVPVRNIYAYDRHGRLLHDVRLYDQDGHPLNVGDSVDPTRRKVRTRGGRTVLNAFPIRYFDPGTGRVAHPNAAPRGLRPRPLSSRP